MLAQRQLLSEVLVYITLLNLIGIRTALTGAVVQPSTTARSAKGLITFFTQAHEFLIRTIFILKFRNVFTI